MNPNGGSETKQKKPMNMLLRVIIAVVALHVGAMGVSRLTAFVESEGAWMALTIAGGYLIALLAFWATGRRDPDSRRRILRWGLLFPACVAGTYVLTVWLGMALHDSIGYDLPRIHYVPISAWENWRYVAGGAALLAGLLAVFLLRPRTAKPEASK